MKTIINKKRIQGCYFGLALGDSLGVPIEFDLLESIWFKYGLSGSRSIICLISSNKTTLWTLYQLNIQNYQPEKQYWGLD
ncbi:MAG: ADP-ribosylglycohydrolase family protein [Candidatus Heimdallarchaeota archaeon]|nr:ADP-ribosylglycohydrolase family protein [Candidatus Heimdallarchaeota archaeon]